ncbi:exodeoxyribonuclease I [Denitrificimonas sp. JX-1]|uniref:Exodeoxyribonuclease I n=1 Tax=Denitrificimonas halotolerans TaxID=3098930 RepID=A0ABU5GQI9_9GAMM|nr:exodeoxyribonuclease I [Denitrificimonas sp. JX-1]MDY7218995.1 exodeoxyribonuclease I [Denitrificimonas sp. JX-1]
MTASIFWYDFETTGVQAHSDRPIQVAGIRTNEQLEEIDEPLNMYCQLSDDILPHPMSSLVTGIGPDVLQQQGLLEVDFIERLHQELIRPNTCTAGFNSIRFDDEMTRATLYRNFYDPYAREWQGGNSRWDLIDVLRCTWALRPEGIEWPEQDGVMSFRLEKFTAVNGIEHGQAHDALADVRATIAVARLLRERQPKLFNYLYDLRRKDAVMERIRLLQPMLHVSGMFSVARHCLSPVLPLAWHPTNRNALIVCDLHADVTPLLELDAQALKERLYTPRVELAEGESPVPLKLIHINKSPVVAPLGVLREEDNMRLNFDHQRWQDNYHVLKDQCEQWRDKLSFVYEESWAGGEQDVEQQLYSGFLAPRDRKLCEALRNTAPEKLLPEFWPFDDERLAELLFRYRGRNYPHTLSENELHQWALFCRARLTGEHSGAPLNIADYLNAYAALTPEQQLDPIVQAWRHHVHEIEQRYQL